MSEIQDLNTTLKNLEDNMATNAQQLVDIHNCMDRLSKRVHENAEKVHNHATTLKWIGVGLGSLQGIVITFLMAAALKGLNLS